MNTYVIIAFLGCVLGILMLLDWYTHNIDKPKFDSEFWVALGVLGLSVIVWLND